MKPRSILYEIVCAVMDFKKTAPPASTNPTVAHAISDWLDEAKASELDELLEKFYQSLRFWVVGQYEARLSTDTIIELYHEWISGLFMQDGLDVPVQQLTYVSLTRKLQNYFDGYLETASQKIK